MNNALSTTRVNGGTLQSHIGRIVILIGEVITVNYGNESEASFALIRSGDNKEINVSLPNGNPILSYVISCHISFYNLK